MTEVPSEWVLDNPEIEQIIMNDDFPHILMDGKVYLDIGTIQTVCRQAIEEFMQMLLMGNLEYVYLIQGINTVSSYLALMESEFLRREANKMMEASQEGPSSPSEGE
jgi:hypothetical protein